MNKRNQKITADIVHADQQLIYRSGGSAFGYVVCADDSNTATGSPSDRSRCFVVAHRLIGHARAAIRDIGDRRPAIYKKTRDGWELASDLYHYVHDREQIADAQAAVQAITGASDAEMEAARMNAERQAERDASPDGMTRSERAATLAAEKRATAIPPKLSAPTFIVVQAGSWGKGDSIDEAARNSRKAGGRGKALIYATTDPKAYVDDYGSLCYKGEGATLLVGRMNSMVPAKAEPKKKINPHAKG